MIIEFVCLQVAKVTKESACNKEVKKQILEAVGPKFFSRLLKTSEFVDKSLHSSLGLANNF